ncbi:MAG: DEAD/DEAH box helicase [Desulfurococcales archaeon]|nr:DEAD/DEAH box helicase [Desulfurococcales archaeon]
MSRESTIIEMLHPKVRELVDEKGWSSLTPVQELALPAIFNGHNVLIMAPTGEGKTEAALLPILSMMLNSRAQPVSLLYITPMKALINDIYLRVKWWTDRLGFKVARKHGDTSSSERSRRLREKPHILITTPESLEIDLDWAPKFRQNYRNLQWIIVDEVHELLASKRGAQFALQLERLRKLTGRDIQVIGLSATVGDPEWTITLLSGASQRPKSIVDPEMIKHPEISIVYTNEDSGDPWIAVARKVVEEVEKPSLIFVNSRYVAERIKGALEELNVRDVFVHHSSVSAELREEAEDKLRSGELSAIVCTKTLEVGIDVGRIRKVIQVKSPGRVASLLQRIGRSGHVRGGTPRGVIIATEPLDLLESMAIASLAVEKKVENTSIRRIPLDVLARQVQGLLLSKKKMKIDDIYALIASSPAVNVSREEFHDLIDYMVSLGTLRREGDYVRLGSGFYKIWRFRGDKGAKAWWSRDFSEFFSMINERDTFIVKYNDRIIGYIDSVFVYRHLRTGDVIRLAGGSWLIKKIDDNSGKVEVEPSDSPAEVPLWRGEGPRRSKTVAERISAILENGVPPGVEVEDYGLEILRRWSKEYRRRGLPTPSTDSVIYETYNDEHIVTVLLGSGANEVLGLIAFHEAMKVLGLNVYYRASFSGFSVKSPGLNPLETFMEINPDEIYDIVWTVLDKSPYLYQVIRDIQLSFGKIGSIDVEEDYFIVEEAKRQVIEEYLDIETAREFITMLQEGKIKVHTPMGGGLTPIAREILKAPPVKPWMPDLARRIARMLEGSALTVFELADILELAEKTVEAKIKDMRRPDYDDIRVVGFIDIDDDDWRWTLLRSLEEVVSMEEFENSFKPVRMREPLRVYIKPTQAHRPKELIVTPETVVKNYERIKQMFPQELYNVRITSAYSENRKDDVVISHYYVTADALKYLLLNAAKYIEEKYYFFY